MNKPLRSKMSTTLSSPSHPIHWVLDFDGTITRADTLNTLVNIAASTKPDFPTQDRWKDVVDAYMTDYSATLKSLAPNGVLPTSIADEKELLKDMRIVEQRSLARVHASKIFEGVRKEDMELGAKNAVECGDVALRPDCADFLSSLAPENLHILSVNWSRHFIASCLATVQQSSIISNELAGIAEGVASYSQILGGVISSSDKLRHLEEIQEQSDGIIVYVGDSWPDIECLLAADVGICVRDTEMGSAQRKLAEALERLEIGCERLGNEDERGMVWVNEWMEIKEWVEHRGRS
jgi:2-hydroxy-3-keto-5-methylthiopentenyl-1-phosphate phosphatase